MKVDYIAILQEYHGSRNDGFLTDIPKVYHRWDTNLNVTVNYHVKWTEAVLSAVKRKLKV